MFHLLRYLINVVVDLLSNGVLDVVAREVMSCQFLTLQIPFPPDSCREMCIAAVKLTLRMHFHNFPDLKARPMSRLNLHILPHSQRVFRSIQVFGVAPTLRVAAETSRELYIPG
jgi:hypothetical protein